MSEEMRNELEVIETEVEEYDYGYVEPEDESNGVGKGLVVAAGTLIVGGATALAIKKKEKIKQWRRDRTIKKLEADGYIIEAPEIEEEEPKKEESEPNEKVKSKKE